MQTLQIHSLRDLAIDNLPRAKADRDQIKRYGGTFDDLYRRLFHTSIMVRGNAGTTAVEYAAANVLESVSLLCIGPEEDAKPLTTSDRTNILRNLVANAKELCSLTGQVIPWLDALPTTPDPEPTAHREPSNQSPLPSPSIAGRFLTTKDAATVLGYSEQTLRKWSSTESGPLSPRKAGRKLLWSGDEILTLLKNK
jgi:Helix-turn-helix domain